ncbi:MAG: hypothetical protein R3B48_21190 [Kofleriaceae bacterium]
MRTCLLLGLTLSVISCASSPGELPDPPKLTVLTPARATVRDQAGLIEVTGTVTPNLAGDRVTGVQVNGVDANLAADGSFTAQVQLAPGATLLHTIARADGGGEARDTRAVHAGEVRSGADLVERGMAVALSAPALASVATAAGTLMKATDFAPILAPLNPMVSAGADNGEDCNWGKVYVHDVNMTDAAFTLVPAAGGITFRAELTNVDVPAHARHEVLCVNGTTNLRMTATKVVVSGTLKVTPKAGGDGFDVVILNPQTQLTGFNLEASGLPGAILNLLNLDSAIGGIIARTAQTFMGPLVNRLLGGLAGPKQIELAGKTIEFQVSTEDVRFDPAGGQVDLSTRMILAGSDATFIYTPNDPIILDPGSGLAIGISDDAANQLLASVTKAGMLNLSLPAIGGTFDTAAISATLPPMISADGATGKLELLAGDLTMTFLAGNQEVAHVAVSITASLSALPSAQGVQLQLDPPEVYATVIDNISGYEDADKEDMIKLVIDHDVELLSLLFGNIPLPELAGMRLQNTTVQGGSGFIQLSANLQ